MRKKEKSLCESCLNRVRIKYHGNVIRKGILESECFYDFKVMVSNSTYKKCTNGATPYEAHVSYVIVDECSFYNKSLNRLNKPKVKEISDADDDTDDSDDSNQQRNGVTFVNIPGALLP